MGLFYPLFSPKREAERRGIYLIEIWHTTHRERGGGNSLKCGAIFLRCHLPWMWDCARLRRGPHSVRSLSSPPPPLWGGRRGSFPPGFGAVGCMHWMGEVNSGLVVPYPKSRLRRCRSVRIMANVSCKYLGGGGQKFALLIRQLRCMHWLLKN